MLIAEIWVFQGSFVDGETEYFQVSNNGGGLLAHWLLNLVHLSLIAQNEHVSPFVHRNPGVCISVDVGLFTAAL